MRATIQTLVALCCLALAVSAKPAKAPNGAWTMDIPNSWGPADPAGYDKLHTSVHAVFHVQPAEGADPAPENAPFRDYLVVSVQEKTTWVEAPRREEFRATLQQELRERGMNAGIENVVVEKIDGRDAWRVEGWLIPPQAKPLKNVKWYVPAGERTFVFSFNASGEDFQYKLGDFEKMAQSIRMKDGAPKPPSRPIDTRLAIIVGGITLFVACGVAFVFVLRRTMRPATGDPA